MLEERELTLRDTFENPKFNAFEVTTLRERNPMQSEQFKNVCWICEGWYEQEFKLSVPAESSPPVWIHFDFEKYEPRLISIKEREIRYVTMVPPKKYKYFFTVDRSQILENKVNCEVLPLSENHEYEMEHEMRSFKVEKVNIRTGKSKKIVNEWDELAIKTLPRANGLVMKKEKVPWTFDKSVWAKEWKLEDEELLRKCFERDWKHSKISNLVKNASDQEKVKASLWKSYAKIKNLYKHFAAWNPFGDVMAVSSNPFTEFCQQARIINKDTPLKIIDLTFITTNSMSSADWKGNALVPERGLSRFQFMESLVRLAEEKFKKNGVTDNFSDSVNLMLDEHVCPAAEPFNANEWRLKQYFTEHNDLIVKKYRPVFSWIYRKNSRAKVKPG